MRNELLLRLSIDAPEGEEYRGCAELAGMMKNLVIWCSDNSVPPEALILSLLSTCISGLMIVDKGNEKASEKEISELVGALPRGSGFKRALLCLAVAAGELFGNPEDAEAFNQVREILDVDTW